MANLDDLSTVDNRVQAFENHRNGLLISIAGPGTGKTYSFLRRINALVTQNISEPQEICYLTFIREISKAFESDYTESYKNSDLLNEDQHPRISTLHSLACRLIRNKGYSIGYDGPLYFSSIADREKPTSHVFLRDLFPLVQSSVLNSIPKLRGYLENEKEFWRNNSDLNENSHQRQTVIETALLLSRAYRLVDWDQAIPLAHQLFLNPQNREKWLTRLQHFLIDEYQDFNKAEQAFIASLASTISSMVIVGDNDQSIFRSRGGSPEGIINLFNSPNHNQITLVRCRRCKSNLLKSVNRFLNWMNPKSTLMLEHAKGGSINCYKFKSSKAEIAFLINYLMVKIEELPKEPLTKDGIVCLFPSKKSLGFYYDKICQSVPSYTKKLKIQPQRNNLMLLLELVSNPEQRFIERMILEAMFPTIKTLYKKQMVNQILQFDVSPIKAIELLISDGLFSGEIAAQGRSFVYLCQNLSSKDSNLIAKELAKYFGGQPERVQPYIQNLLSHLEEKDQEDLLNDICDNILPEQALPKEDKRSVLFLTIQGSKGLTKKVVVLPGLEQAWLPGRSTGEDLEEKKRLFYVAISRATDDVQITFPFTRGKGDPLNYQAEGRGEVSEFVVHAGIPIQYYE